MNDRQIHPATRYAFAVASAWCVALYATVAVASPGAGDDLKAVLQQPWPLLGVMYAGALASALKTVSTARRSGADVTPLGYLSYWPETLSAVGAVFAAWLGLLFTDQLNFAAAAAWGAASNTFADIIRSGGRTAALSPDQPTGNTGPQASGG